MTTQILNDSFSKVIKGAIITAINEIIDEEIKSITEKVQEKVRARAAGIACRVLDHYSMEMLGEKLVIQIDISNPLIKGR